MLYGGKNKLKKLFIKFISHKKKTTIYKKRTELKNVRITELFPHSTTATALAGERLYINKNLTSVLEKKLFLKSLQKSSSSNVTHYGNET